MDRIYPAIKFAPQTYCNFGCSSINKTKAKLLDNIVRVGIVSYLNTRPLLFGIEHSGIRPQIELIQDYPAKIAGKLLEGSIDIGLIPVAVIPSLKEKHIVTNYCIGCDGPVASVCLFSEVPLEEVEASLIGLSKSHFCCARKIIVERILEN
jgi:chorismate dehydratase